MNLHPKPFSEPVSVREAIGKDGWIEYRRDYQKGSTLWRRTGFDKPSPGLRATLSDWRWNVGSEERRFTEEELKAVAGYPAKFRFAPGMVQTWKRIGNSVPPLFMKAIAGFIRSGVLEFALQKPEDSGFHDAKSQQLSWRQPASAKE